MARVRLFAALREAAGTGTDEIEAGTVGLLVEEAKRRYGSQFAQSLPFASIAVNGTLVSELDAESTALSPADEVAFLPPVSGGAGHASEETPFMIRAS